MTTCAIMQPTYLPWLGYFDLIDQVDIFVYLDTVQLVKRSFQVRNRIKSNGQEFYLSVPILKEKHRNETFINTAHISYSVDWMAKHLKTIKNSYQKATFFDPVFQAIAPIITFRQPSLADLNIALISKVCELLGLSTASKRSSEITEIEGAKDVLLAGICHAVKADTYLSAAGSAEYIEADSPGGAFINQSINLFYQHYTHPEYRQLGKEFIPYICILDLLFNEGPERSLDIIRRGRSQPDHYKEYRTNNSKHD